MKPRDALPWLRAGALSAGVTTLLLIWWMQWQRLGYFDVSWIMVLLTFAGSIALGATLGHRERRPLRWRLLLALAVGGAIGLVEGGVVLGLASTSRFFGRFYVATFVVCGAALTLWGLRRLPASRAARAGLLVVLVLLTATGGFASSPAAMRSLERRFHPLPLALVRAAWEDNRCGAAYHGRARVVEWTADLRYGPVEERMNARAHVRATLEATTAFSVDGCNRPRLDAKLLEAPARDYPTTAACMAAWRHMMPEHWFDPDSCCTIETHTRQPGDRLKSVCQLSFDFRPFHWVVTDDAWLDRKHRDR